MLYVLPGAMPGFLKNLLTVEHIFNYNKGKEWLNKYSTIKKQTGGKL